MIFLLPLYMGVGILCAVLVNRFFVRRFSDEHRKTSYVITVVLFVLASGLLFLIHGAKIKVTEIVDQKALELTDYVVREYPEIPLVAEGYDVSRLNEALAETRSALPVSIMPDGGLPGKIADDVYKRIVDTVFAKVQGTLTGAQVFSENNRITFSSVVNGLKTRILYRLNQVVFYARIVLLAILLVYTAYCVCTSIKNQKKEHER